MSLTRQKTTLSPLTAHMAPIPHGPPSMTLRRTNVSSEPFRRVYMLPTACILDRTLDVYSNTFCAGGNVLGNGTWVIFGGNQRKCAVFSPFRTISDTLFYAAVTTGGVASTDAAAYSDTDGGSAIRMINPCTDETCEYIQGETSYDKSQGMGGWLQMTGKRWYPTAEALEDGSLIVIGGDKNGGYVNTAAQDNPTYEFFPPRDGDPVNLQFLTDTLPVNLYPLVWLLPSGKLFMQAYRKTILYDYNTKTTTDLPDMPYATRVYPASAATVMLPLTPANNYTVTLLFCGGSNTTQWGDDGSAGYNVTAVPADGTCVRISPDNDNPQYEDDDYMFEGRSMGQFVILPDGTFWMGNGVAMGTAGYGNEMYSVGRKSSVLFLVARANSLHHRILRSGPSLHARSVQLLCSQGLAMEPNWPFCLCQRTNVPLHRYPPS